MSVRSTCSWDKGSFRTISVSALEAMPIGTFGLESAIRSSDSSFGSGGWVKGHIIYSGSCPRLLDVLGFKGPREEQLGLLAWPLLPTLLEGLHFCHSIFL